MTEIVFDDVRGVKVSVLGSFLCNNQAASLHFFYDREQNGAHVKMYYLFNVCARDCMKMISGGMWAFMRSAQSCCFGRAKLSAQKDDITHQPGVASETTGERGSAAF